MTTIPSRILSNGLKAITNSRTYAGKWGRRTETFTQILEKRGDKWEPIIERNKTTQPRPLKGDETNFTYRSETTTYHIGDKLKKELSKLFRRNIIDGRGGIQFNTSTYLDGRHLGANSYTHII